MKHILAISGSPRHNSNTALLCNSCLEAAAAEGAETRLLELCNLQIAPCQACANCVDHAAGERCIIDDDMSTVLTAMLWADAIIFGTPTYMGGMSAQLKALIDRTRPIWSPENTLQHRTASVIAVGEGRWGGQELAARSVMDFCFNHGMIVLGPACLPYGNWEVIGQAAAPGQVAGDEFALKAAQGLGRRLARLQILTS
ncbi:MAG: flavodoxin family protein [Armatimonadia bacterium]